MSRADKFSFDLDDIVSFRDKNGRKITREELAQRARAAPKVTVNEPTLEPVSHEPFPEDVRNEPDA